MSAHVKSAEFPQTSAEIPQDACGTSATINGVSAKRETFTVRYEEAHGKSRQIWKLRSFRRNLRTFRTFRCIRTELRNFRTL